MGENLSLADRGIRIISGFGFIWAVLYVPMSATMLWVLTFVGVILIPTGLAGYCPFYSALKIKTKS